MIYRRIFLAVGAMFCLLAFLACQSGFAADSKPVLMLRLFGFRFKPWTDFAETFRAELTRQSKFPIDYDDQSLTVARLGDDKSDTPFVDYLHSLYAEKAPDLIVAIGSPAAN